MKSVTVTNYLGESLKLEMRRPETSGFYIKKIDGLGPSKANINVTERATVDGGQYSSAHANSRNIVMYLGFVFAHGVENVRHKSYKYFPLKKRVKLVFETDTRICETYGYVESNEPDIFSSDESTQISIICPDPYFYSTVEDWGDAFSAVEPLFEFPFSNESLSDPIIEFGYVAGDTANFTNVIYKGEVEVGVNILIHAVGGASNVAIYNELTREFIKIDTSKLKASTGYEILTGDDITICTVKGQKSATLFRNGKSINILNCLDKQSSWLQLSSGDNAFIYDAETGLNNLQFRFEFRTAYEGV